MEALKLDIPIELAQNAFYGTSFSPEKRGEQVRQGYAETLVADYNRLLQYAETDEEKAILETEFARYRNGYREKTLAWLRARGRCLSTMIAGPSNFPVNRARKANRAESARADDKSRYRERALAAIEKLLRPEIRPVMAGDADAETRLQEKITAAEKDQELMKAVNKAIRKFTKQGYLAQMAGIMAVDPSLTEARAKRLLEPDCFGGLGFAGFELTNNNANIRRMKERLVQVSREKQKPDEEVQGDFAILQDAPADNRYRLTFPGKPSAEVREKLKRNGFRWTPTLGVWQAYRNSNSRQVALEIAGYPRQNAETKEQAEGAAA